MVFGGCYASLSRRSSKPSLPSLTCAPCLLPRKISAAISASHQENGRTKTQSGKLAPMGATLVVALIKLECRFIVLFQRRILVLLAQIAITNCKTIQFRTHEAPERIFRRADNGLSTDIEAGIDQDRVSRLAFEGCQQGVIARVGAGMHGLDACRIIDVRDSRNIGARHIELLNAEELLLLRGHLAAPGRHHVGYQKHVGAVTVELEPVLHALPDDRRREWSK